MRNIVLLTFDSIRADHCSYLGYNRETTPNIASKADDGLSYSNAISPASRTNPSMAGIMTGEPMYYRGEVANPTHARKHLSRHGTIAEDLSKQGYATAAFCPNAYASRYYGFDRGFDEYEDFLFSSERYQQLWEKHISDSGWFTTFRNIRNFIRREEAFRTWETYLDDAIDWATEQTEPFFLWMFSLDTHYPYLTPGKYREFSSLFDQYYYNWRCYKLIGESEAEFSERTKQKMIDIYDDSIRFGDFLVKELRERLSELNPVCIVHSDHGEAFGERGMYGHSFPYLYDENVRVPLIISGTNGSEHVTEPVSLLRLREGISRLVNDHRPNLSGEVALSTEYDGRNDRNLKAIRSEKYKYILTSSRGKVDRELYDLESDPDETENVAQSEPAGAQELRIKGEKYALHDRELMVIEDAVTDLEGI